MDKLLVAQSLPFVDVHIEDCYPIKISHEVVNLVHQYAIMKDGSICRIVQLSDMQHLVRDLVTVLNKLENSMVLQIHKLVINGSVRVLFTIQKILNYESVCPTWLDVLKSVITGPYNIKAKINRDTFNALNTISRLIPDTGVPINFRNNVISEFLIGNGDDNAIKCNLGIIRASKNKFVSSMSINNIGSVPSINNIVKVDHLQVISFVRPSIERERTLKNDTIDKTVLISTLAGSSREQREVQVHTITSSDDYIDTLQGGFFYCNVKYVFTSDSIEGLNETNNHISSLMYENNLVPYNHTISGKNEYISSFPGNALYGEQYHVITQSIAGMLTNRMIYL